VHREFAQVAIWQDGRVRHAGQIPATPEGLRLFADSLAPTDEVALEATCNGRPALPTDRLRFGPIGTGQCSRERGLGRWGGTRVARAAANRGEEARHDSVV
jgi:hypothetical protein